LNKDILEKLDDEDWVILTRKYKNKVVKKDSNIKTEDKIVENTKKYYYSIKTI
jgi:hypothetical protein